MKNAWEIVPSNNICKLIMQVYWLLIVAIVAQTVRAEGDNWAENTASDPTADACVWLDPVNSYYIPELNRKQITKVDADACKKACEDETDFNCYSFDFNGRYDDCFLQSRDRYSVKLKASASYNVRYAKYYERNCRADYPDQCVWEAEMSGVMVSENDLLTLTSKTVDECKKACEDESTFHCQSFDYHLATSKCFLSVASRYTTALTVQTGYSYYERNCQVKYQKCSGASPNVEWSDAWHAKYLPAPVLATMKMTIDECKLACVQQDTFHCRSFEYTEMSKECALHAYNRQDYSDFIGGKSVHQVLETHSDKNYYELIECLEEAKPQPPVCGDGMEFKECTSNCLPTCDDPEGTECSTTECVPKCTCKEGLVYNSANDTCVSPNELCGCLNPKTNKLAKIGERFLSDNCTKTCICKSHGADLKCKDYTCATNTVCQKSDGVSSCVCEDPPNIFIRGQCKPRCQQPKKVGSCSGSERRFFFSKKKQRCRPLNYTGCGDNGNNFETKEACMNLCMKFTTPPECLLPKEESPCDDETVNYYFDGENCRKLRYGFCQGNANNFETKLACRNYCKRPPTS